MLQTFIRSGSAAAAVPANAATTGEYSSDEMLVTRIAAGDKLAMQALFARHRGSVYRWLLRFVGNETVAEDLLSDVFFDVWQQAGRFERRFDLAALDRPLQGALRPPSSHRCAARRDHRGPRGRPRRRSGNRLADEEP